MWVSPPHVLRINIFLLLLLLLTTYCYLLLRTITYYYATTTYYYATTTYYYVLLHTVGPDLGGSRAPALGANLLWHPQAPPPCNQDLLQEPAQEASGSPSQGVDCGSILGGPGDSQGGEGRLQPCSEAKVKLYFGMPLRDSKTCFYGVGTIRTLSLASA